MLSPAEPPFDLAEVLDVKLTKSEVKVLWVIYVDADQVFPFATIARSAGLSRTQVIRATRGLARKELVFLTTGYDMDGGLCGKGYTIANPTYSQLLQADLDYLAKKEAAQ